MNIKYLWHIWIFMFWFWYIYIYFKSSVCSSSVVLHLNFRVYCKIQIHLTNKKLIGQQKILTIGAKHFKRAAVLQAESLVHCWKFVILQCFAGKAQKSYSSDTSPLQITIRFVLTALSSRPNLQFSRRYFSSRCLV